MKKYLFLTILSAGLFFTSCGSDDSKKNDSEVVTKPGKWEPTTIQLVKVVPLQTIDYPHTANCNKDYLELSAGNKAIFFRYEGTDCKVTEYADAFQRTGNNVSLNVLGYKISGTVAVETATNMEIHSDISEYIPLITAQFPEYEQYLSLLEGGTVKLSFIKK